MAGMPCPLQQACQGGDDLGHGDRQHCGQWRHQRLLAVSDTAQPQPQTAGLPVSQHGCRQVCDDHLAGKDRHNYGHEMMPGGLPALLPYRLTESTVWSEDRILPGLESYLAELVGSP